MTIFEKFLSCSLPKQSRKSKSYEKYSPIASFRNRFRNRLFSFDRRSVQERNKRSTSNLAADCEIKQAVSSLFPSFRFSRILRFARFKVHRWITFFFQSVDRFGFTLQFRATISTVWQRFSKARWRKRCVQRERNEGQVNCYSSTRTTLGNWRCLVHRSIAWKILLYETYRLNARLPLTTVYALCTVKIVVVSNPVSALLTDNHWRESLRAREIQMDFVECESLTRLS